jgi:hypothetical protein
MTNQEILIDPLDQELNPVQPALSLRLAWFKSSLTV